MALALLPNEILSEILAAPLSYGTLYNVALVSSRFSDLAQRALWQTISLHVWRECKNDLKSAEPLLTKKGEVTYERIVNTLRKYPHLQLYVKTLSLHIFRPEDHVNCENHTGLLKLVPRLQSLDISPPLPNFRVSESNFPALRTLTIDLQYVPWKDEAEVVARQLWAPSLRALRLDNICFNAPSEMSLFSPDKYRTSSITELTLLLCKQGDMGYLPGMLSCIKALSKFNIEVDTSWEELEEARKNTMEPGALSKAIGVHANTLVQLEIAGSDAVEFPESTLFGSLVEYSKVKRLAIPESFLVRPWEETHTLVDVLPPNVEELQLQYPEYLMGSYSRRDPWRETRVRRLRQLAAAKIWRFPALRRVIWWTQAAEDDIAVGETHGLISDMRRLRQKFSGVGVKFEWMSEAFFKGTPFQREEVDRDSDEELTDYESEDDEDDEISSDESEEEDKIVIEYNHDDHEWPSIQGNK